MIEKILNQPADSFGAVLMFLGLFFMALGLLGYIFSKIDNDE